jgi:YD repeat-containing protein
MAQQDSITLPSPRAQAFHIYGDIPVSYSSGIPDISIPIYTMSYKGVEVPIVLKYHTASLKPLQQDGSNMAYGWMLDYGGRISRTVMDEPDELGISDNGSKIKDIQDASELNESLTTLGTPGEADFDMARDYLINHYEEGNFYDTQYDRFYFDFLHHGGKFFMEYVDGEWSPHFGSPYPWLVNTTTIGSYFHTISFTDIKGLTYNFGGDDKTESSNSDWQYVSWLLSDIVDANENKLFDYNYTSLFSMSSPPTYVDGLFVKDEGYFGLSTSCDADEDGSDDNERDRGIPYFDYISDGLEPAYSIRTIDSINFNLGYVKFYLDSNNETIESVVVRDMTGAQVLKVVFGKSNFNLYNKVKLDSVSFYDSDDKFVKKYEFSYDYDNGGGSVGCTVDYWGYCNLMGYDVTAGLNPSFTVNYLYNNGNSIIYESEMDGVSRTSNSYAYEHALTSIKYPTGGETIFEYQLNEYSSQSNLEQGGGFRASKIINKNNDSEILATKEYEYSSGSLLYDPYEENEYGLSVNYDIVNTGCSNETITYPIIFKHRVYSANPTLPLENVKYEYVIEKMTDGTTYNGSNTYQYYINYPTIKFKIEEMEDSYFNKQLTNGTPVDCYDNLDFFRESVNGGTTGYGGAFISQYVTSTDPRLYKKTTKDSNGDTLRIERNTYNQQINDTLNNIIIEKLGNYSSTTSIEEEFDDRYSYIVGLPNSSYSTNPDELPPVFFHYNYDIVCDYYELDNTVVEERLDGGNIETTSIYTYDANNQIASLVNTSSIGDDIETQYYYPGNYDDLQNFSTLIDKNIIGKPIDVRTYKESQLVSGTQTKYNNNGQAIEVYQAEIESNTTDIEFDSVNPYDFTLKAEYSYDDNNMLYQVAPTNNYSTFYVWGYDEQYPVAKIITGNDISLSVTVIDSELSYSDTYSDIEDDVEYLEGLLSSYLSDSDYQVTIYTYKPLIGITSQTDPNGKTTYYEYDDFGRLKTVRDNDGNILNTYEYNYSSSN